MFRLNTLAIAIALASNFYLNDAQALPINALPTGGQTAQGQVLIQQTANQLQINQNSPKAVINWDTFNIGKDAGVTFNQPNAQSSTLNRVINGSSEIAGRISANGQVFLLNPNGVLFSPTAQVNTASLVVATGDISDTDYLKGHGTIQNSTNGAISNLGNLTVAQGGKIVLSSQQINNAGHITAQNGQVQLLAGQKTRVNITADGLIATELDIDNNNTANIQNSGTISATGGRVDVLAAGSNSQITHTGIIEAQSTVTRDGKIYLVAGYQGEGIAPKSGSAVIDGQLDVSAPNGGNGGFVETSAGQIKIGDQTRVNAIALLGKNGLWLIDPQDFTIAASGGDISGATLSTNLATGDVTILSSSGANSAGSGDIHVNDNVTWNANQLTLTAAKDININAVLFVNGGVRGGSGTLVLNSGTTNGADAGVAGGLVKFGLTQSGFTGRVDFAVGGQGLLTINGENYWIANTLTDLQDILALSAVNQFVGNFAIGQNLDATTTSTMNGGLGFDPLNLGTVKFDGLGHVIDQLFINRPSQSQVGLFGTTYGTVSNVGLSNAKIAGQDDVGGLIGHNNSTVLSSFVRGQVTAISNNVGGLIGTNDGDNGGNVSDSYVLGAVTGTDLVGGLVGTNVNGQLNVGEINHSYARGSVNGRDDVGGLVGLSQDGVIHGSYATSDVTSTGVAAGGLVGGNTTQGVVVGNFNIIDTSYATGTVSGATHVGGLVGYNEGNISNTYATGKSTSTSDVGGLVGINLGDINNAYWDMQRAEQVNPIGIVSGTSSNLTGLTTAQMHQSSSFGNWGATIDGTGSTGATWRIYGGNTAPLLRYFLKPITVTVNALSNSNQTQVYNGDNQTYAFQTSQSYSTPLMGSLLGDTNALLVANGRNTGNYVANLNQNALYSDQQGYDISFVDQTTANTNTLNITPASLVIGSNDVVRVYDATTDAAGTAIAVNNTQLLGADYLMGGNFIFDNKNVANGKTVTTSNVLVNDSNSGNNYIVTYADNTTSQITPATLTVSAIADNKVYDATTAATASLTDDRFSGDDLNISTSGAYFADKNVGSGKGVTVNGVTLSGADALNYTLDTTPVTALADITPATLTVSAIADSKVYDATTAATTSLTDDRYSGDIVNVSTSGAYFSDKNVGNDKDVTVNGVTLSGTDASNYILASAPVTALADITPATLTVSATADSKVYDATTIATTSLTDNRFTGDALTVSTSGADFSDKNVANGKTVTVNGVTVSGTDALNYTLDTTPVTAVADITPATLTVTATADSKVYDATAIATTSLTDDRYSGDIVNVSTSGAYFSDKNVGNDKDVTVNGVTLSGADAGNYTLASAPVTALADITPATLTVSAIADSKVYDATTAATASLTDDRFSGDDLNISTSGANFSDKNAGNGKKVVVNGVALSGTDAANYSLAATPVTSTANITPATLTVYATADNKGYDATTVATTLLTDNRFSGDILNFRTSGSNFSDKNVGSDKTVTVSGLTLLAGEGSTNYVLSTAPVTALADITPATLTVTATADNKVYDATIAATAHLTDDRFNGDVLNVTTSGANFSDKNVGNDKDVTVNGVTLSGTDAANYTLATSPVITIANITPATLTVSAIADNKVYDATTLATTSFTDGRFSGDILSLISSGANFSDKNVGNSKTVTVNGVTLSGADANNYIVASGPLIARANITPATLTVSAIADNKLFDNSTAATASLTDNRFSGDVINISTRGATFLDKNVGNDKTVTVNGVTLTGLDASNYRLAQPVTARANIEGLPADAIAGKLAFPCNGSGICSVVIQPPVIKPIFDVYLPPSLQECEAQNLKTTPADCILKPKEKIKITTASDDDGQAAIPIQSKRALIIANSHYQNVAQLAGVKKDSQAIQQELAQLGYQVTVVDDASRAEMITVLNQMIQQSNRDDSVLIYYAGHGYVTNGSSVGYWLPTDARIDHGEQWISTIDVARFINNIAAKQILLVSDSCFSGSLSYEAALHSQTALNKNAVLKRRSVMVLTSGGEEPVADSGTSGLSPFAASFVQSMGQVSKDSDLRGQNLYKNVYQQVTSKFKQYPTYGGLDSAGNMLGGEYIFEKK